MLSYYLPQTSEVHGASHSETIVDGITFAISADNVYKGELLDVTLSVAGTWNSFYGRLLYNETQFDGAIGPLYDGYSWSGTYSIPNLDIGCYNLTFEAWYWPEGGSPWQGPVTASVLVYVMQVKPTATLMWLTPLSKRDSFEAGRTIPIRFSVYDDDTGDFKCDESVTVTVTNEDGDVVFSAGCGKHRNDVRIRESAQYYVVYWKTAGSTPGLYRISVEFEQTNVQSPLLRIWLR